MDTPDILINDIGAVDGLSCHTHLASCCRDSDTHRLEGALGEWFYPGGCKVVKPKDLAEFNGEDFYLERGAQRVGLFRRQQSSFTGTYCCKIPSITGTHTLCANIGENQLHCFCSAFYLCVTVYSRYSVCTVL